MAVDVHRVQVSRWRPRRNSFTCSSGGVSAKKKLERMGRCVAHARLDDPRSHGVRQEANDGPVPLTLEIPQTLGSRLPPRANPEPNLGEPNDACLRYSAGYRRQEVVAAVRAFTIPADSVRAEIPTRRNGCALDMCS
jgi:hypothetical protein